MFETGRVLGRRYEILQEIGSGGMAIVYKARDTKLGRMVAIKVLKQEMALDNTILGKFRKEALAAGSLNHPNIVGVYDLSHELSYDYIVMEYIDGITLKEYIRRRGTLSCEEVLKVSIKIADALKAAHANGIVHRDIKPQNILVTPQGDVKVTDFGIAKAATSSTVTARGETLGSVHYISPEQARGAEVDARSDLYSLGITMYEMATKSLPFVADTPVGVAMMQLHEPFPNPLEKAPQLWDGLCDIIIKLTQKKPELRYQDADALMTDMRRLYRNHNYRIQTAFRPHQRHKAPDAIILQEQEKERIRLEKARIQKEREARVKEKQRRRNWIIAVAVMGAVLLALLVALVISILTKGSQSANRQQTSSATSQTRQESSAPRQENESSQEQVHVLKAKDYTGMTYEEAQTMIRDYGCYLQVVGINNESVEVGRVVSQFPKEGETISDDKIITLYVSIGAAQEFVEMPDLKDKTLAEAEELLKEQGLKVGKITPAYSSEVEEGKILSQTTPAGTEVLTDTSVDFTISLGESEVNDLATEEGQITISNPFQDEKGTGLIKVDVIDSNGNTTTVYQGTITYATFSALGGAIKVNYPAGTVLVEVYMDGVLLLSQQIS